MNPKRTEQSDYISVAEVARVLGLSRMAIFKRIQKGQIKAIKIGRSYAIPRSYLWKDIPETKISKKKADITYLSVPELAQRLGLTRMAVFLKIKKGEIYAEKVGRHYAIPVSAQGVPVSLIKSGTEEYSTATKKLYSLPQLAQFIGVSRNSIFQKVKNGRIKATRVGRHYSVSADFLQNLPIEGAMQAPVKDREYISIAEYARQLGVSRIAIFKQVKKGKIKAIKIGRSYAIPIGELDK